MRPRICLAVATAGLSAGAALAAPGLLGDVERGRWAVTSRDGGPTRAICLGNPAQLLQVAHPGGACRIGAVEEGAGRVTVHYSCPGKGYGRTTIRRETAALLQIESQGVAGERPFQFTAEARRTGACR